MIRLKPKNNKEVYRASLVITLISFALFALGYHYDDGARIFLQVFFPPFIPLLYRETMGNGENTYDKQTGSGNDKATTPTASPSSSEV